MAGVKMIDVKILAYTNIDPIVLASHAASVCYKDTMPDLGKRLKVKEKLFQTGHHTTLQHHYVTFSIEGMAVGDITLGMHLVNLFYTTCQRSGRYCANMFLKPDYGKIEGYVRKFWPDISNKALASVVNYVKTRVEIYHANIVAAMEIAVNFIAEERPFASDIIEGNASKYAQEQMRMFIPVIFPIAFDFTINNSVLVAMYESAWTPPMRYVTGEMARLFVEKYPKTAFMFKEDRRRKDDWAIKVKPYNGIRYKPSYELLGTFGSEIFFPPDKKIMHPVDRLHFTPEMMGNSIGDIKSFVKISLATMGQDQRHRTIHRGIPEFTGNFYIPPILRTLELEDEAIETMRRWLEVSKIVPDTLAMILAPYGAMLSYDKSGSFNDTAHEQAKRLCLSAQEEIYHLGRLQRMAIEEYFGKDSLLLSMFEPPCYAEGICSEGDRYCGRDIKVRETGDYFPERKV